MAIADTSDTRLAFIPEVTWGATPATPAFQKVRYTGENFAHAKATVVSNEIRSDAEVADLVQVGVSGEGGYDFELSSGAEFNTLFEHSLRGSFAQVDTGVYTGDVGSVSTFTRVTGSYLVDGFRTGQTITSTGYTAGANNGSFTVASVAALTLTIVETTLVVESGGGNEQITVAGATLLKGGIEKKSLSWEKFLEGGATDSYQRFTGGRMNNFNLDFSTNEIVTGRFDVIGKEGEALDTAIIAGATYVEPNTNDIFNAVQGAVLTVGGVSGSIFLTNLTMALTNNAAPRNAIGNLPAIDVRYGRREITGNITAYFDASAGGKELYDAFRAHTAGALRWSVDDGANSYTFHLPRVKYATGVTNIGGNNEDVLVEATYQALVDTAFGTSIYIIA